MYQKILFTLFLVNLLLSTKVHSETTDLKWLSDFIERNEIRPIRNEPVVLDHQYYLGQALFFEKSLSTNKDIACSTCHLVNNHTSDSLPKGIGSGGRGLGKLRILGKNTNVQ